MNNAGGEVDDPLGLDVEVDSKFPEDQLMVLASTIYLIFIIYI